MSGRIGNLGVLMAVVVVLCCRGNASSTATITVGGAEQSGDTNTITVSFNGFVETVTYGQFSTQASVASAFGGMFSRDYALDGLCAKASGSVINFTLRGEATFGAVDIVGSTTSFQLTPSSFSTESTQVMDIGTVTLTVNGSPKTVNYGPGSSASTIAAELAAQSYGSGISVTAGDGVLYISAAAGTGGNNIPYSVSSSSNNNNFSPPSFSASPTGGTLQGGTNGNSSQGRRPRSTVSPTAATTRPGNLTGYTDSSNNAPVMGTWTYSYDYLNRLIGGAASTGPYANQNLCWSYDHFGNRTAQEFQGTTACPAAASGNFPTATVNYNANNQVTWVQNAAPGGFQYDAAGNVQQDALNTYLYDAEGRICAVADTPMPGMTTMTGYLYDADGARVSKGIINVWSCDPTVNGYEATADYVLGPSGEQVTEMTVSGGTSTWAHTNVWSEGKLLGTYNTQSLYFYFTDPLGTRRAQTDYLGSLEQTQSCQSLPYGDGESCQPTPTTENLFTGKERDVESGNDYFEARYYGSSMGRFMSPDPIIMNELRMVNPQRWNKYAYVINNPLILTDPTGKDAAYVAFTDKVGGLGHAGVLSIHKDGTATLPLARKVVPSRWVQGSIAQIQTCRKCNSMPIKIRHRRRLVP